MKKLWITVLLLMGLGLQVQAAKVPTETGNYCKDEVLFFMDDYFGDEVEITDISFNSYGKGEFDITVKVDACTGYFLFRPYRRSASSCTNVHYSKKYTHYMNRVYPRKDCKRLLPKKMNLKRRPRDF